MSVELMEWRRAVSDLYTVVRALPPAEGHAQWVAGRNALFRDHPQSPLRPDDPRRATGLPTAPYDPAWRVTCPVEAAAPASYAYDTGTDGRVVFDRLGVARTPWGSLDVWWLRGYGGGLFVPVRDGSAGTGTYGGGRYLLDSVKGADLGSTGERLHIDLNFAYHPSCFYDSAWACPLAPAGNELAVTVPVGERLA